MEIIMGVCHSAIFNILEHCNLLLSAPLVLVFVFWISFNEKLYRSLKS